MQEMNHNARARRLLEQVFGKGEIARRVADEVIMEKEQRGFYAPEVLEFLLGDRQDKGNIFQGTEEGFDTYIIRANTEEGDLFIAFTWRGDLLCIGPSRITNIRDDLEHAGAKEFTISADSAPYVLRLASILRVGFCTEIKANGSKMRFVQFDVRTDSNELEILRVYDHGEITKWP